MEKAIAAQATVISARVDLKIDQKMSPMAKEISDIRNHQIEQNGWIERHSLSLDAHETDLTELQVHCDSTDKAFNFLKKRWYIVLIAFSLFVLGVQWIGSNIDLIKTIENKTGVELIEDTQ